MRRRRVASAAAEAAQPPHSLFIYLTLLQCCCSCWQRFCPPSASAAGLDPIIFARAGADCICFYNFCDETRMRTDAGRRGEGEGGWLSNFRRSDTLDPLVMLKIYTLPKQNRLLFNFLDCRKSSFIRRFLLYIACSYSGFISTFCDLKLE